MSSSVVVVGGGGHGRVVIDALLSAGASVVGVLDPGLVIGEHLLGVEVLGGDEWLEGRSPLDVQLVLGVGDMPGRRPRRKIYEHLRGRGFRFAPIVHPSVIVGRGVTLSDGCQVMSGVVLQCGVAVGENSVINTRASIDHDCRIGDHVFIGPGAVLGGEVLVGRDAYVGVGAVVLPGVSLSASCVVAAGAVVTKDVPAGATVLGNPAKERHP